ncbi:metallophosphoesterase family protein [Hymenobacter arizonensis]|uniref:3',5'-cyclic AMP phosphodiesterase CpdA n=1 Tax=Hymenobacter arizonensis TaxID=1227077 RepID=A0A1I6AJL5_HYMAR|nr:metallophosphoesterase [Hymenobacter arizonensis]SFQ68894.1 3',5'-cyclic AMP phosphodiesterase CpdA [Hymenobacter arizonensis]
MSPLSTLRRWFRAAPLAILVLSLSGCDLLEFSPNDSRVPEEFTNLTQKNLAKLEANPLAPGDTLRFVFTGDSQQFYDEAEALVKSVNQQPDISFLLVAGDISDFGLAREMRWVDEKLRRLNVPYLTVVGNHDLIGNGRETYQRIFGDLNYSFVYGDTKFIMVDTNGREYNFNGQVPNMGWLKPQLANFDGARRQVVVAHVPPNDVDFDPALSVPYAQALRDTENLVLKMNGHRHSSSVGQPYDDGVTYVNSDAFSERTYMVVTVWGDREFRIKQVQF